MAAYHGKTGRVLVSVNAAGVALNVLSLTEWALNMPTDRVEVTSFGDGNKTYVQGLRDIGITFSGFWNDAETQLMAASTSPTGCKIYLYPDFVNAPTKMASGLAWLDVSVTTGVAAAVGVSGTAAALGTWAIAL